MDVFEDLKNRYGFAPGEGLVDTSVKSVRFFWSTQPVPRAPLVYSAGLVIILQGRKQGFMGDHEFHYDPNQYLVLSVPVSFDCAADASPESPLLGLFVDIDPAEMHELSELVPAEDQPNRTETTSGVQPAALSPDMRVTIQRLLAALTSDAAGRAIGPGLVRELLFHALNGPHGQALRSLTQTDSHHVKIAKTIAHIRENYSQPLRVDDLAHNAGMSEPVFHRAFKVITGSSPHQYLKSTRLHLAKQLIISDGLQVAVAARQVGYENPAHFSREFKKYFRVSPKVAQGTMSASD